MQIKIENIYFSYHKNKILEGISSYINKGRIIALVGPNGSGKSTLMKCINKILNYQKGDIKIENTSISKISRIEIAKKIAYVPQHETKISGINVFDMILMGRKPYISWRPSEKDYKITTEIMESLKISHLSMKDFSEISGGQQQMVYIARAIAQEPDILLLDEPTNNLDIKHQLEIMELLKILSDQGKTVIITLHDINLAFKYCEKYILLKNGKIFVQGNKENITKEHLEELYQIKIKMIKHNKNIFIIPEYIT